MAHYRKEIRKVLDEMGFKKTTFSVREKKSGPHHEKFVTIEGWEPNPKAYELKKTIERAIHDKVSVCFSGPHISEKFCLK